MTVEEAIKTINRVHESINILDDIIIKYELKNGEAVAVKNTINDLMNYVDELRRKTVR